MSKLIYIDNIRRFLIEDAQAGNAIYFANHDTLLKLLSYFKVDDIPPMIPPMFWCYGYQFRVMPELQNDEILVTNRRFLYELAFI